MFIAYLFSILSTVVLMCIFTKCTRMYKSWKLFLEIPGPPAASILGNTSLIKKSSEDLFLYRKELASKFLIYREWVLHYRLVHIIDPEDVKIVLTTGKTKKMYTFLHNWLGTGLLTSEGTKWQYRRKLLTPAFHLNTLQNFIDIFNTGAEKLAKELNTNDFLDISVNVSNYVMNSIKGGVIGTLSNELERQFNKYAQDVNDIGEIFLYRIQRPWMYKQCVYDWTRQGEQEKQIIYSLHNFTSGVLKSKREELKHTEQSTISTMLEWLLVSNNKGADIDDIGIREEIDTFVFEAYDTTTLAFKCLLMELSKREDIQEKIFEEMKEVLNNFNKKPTYNDFRNLKYMDCCIRESLRLYPSVPTIMIRAVEDIKTHTGYIIPAGVTMNIHISNLHRNANIYPDPEKFDPERFLPENVQNRHPFAYIPFSAGKRNCIGQKFAVLQLKAALCTILRDFILKPNESKISFTAYLTLKTTSKILIKFEPRNHARKCSFLEK